MVNIADLGMQPYLKVWHAMKEFTDNRHENTVDEIWLVEHPPVFTQGQAGKPEHLLDPGNIPVVQTDRGGQVTYHGPGQLLAYFLIDIQRKRMKVRQLVTALEQSIIALLQEWNIQAHSRCNAPGVYVDETKIASLGLRVRKGFSYHGLALNVAMDLSPFEKINPCGFQGLRMTQLAHWQPDICVALVKPTILSHLLAHLGYNQHQLITREIA